MNTYPVHERFHAFQGEGVHAGRSAFFIRLFGCPVHCPWCDSAGTWHKDWVPGQVERVSPEQLALEARESGAEFVVLTGGEPAVHKLDDLTFELSMAGFKVHIETCGAFKFDMRAIDWVTVSPKWDRLPLESILRRSNELKIIVDAEDAIERWVAELLRIGKAATLDEALRGALSGVGPIYLHPEWSRREDPVILQKIATWVKQYGDPFRAGWQLHKLYQVDRLDPRAVLPAPLGGNPSLGY